MRSAKLTAALPRCTVAVQAGRLGARSWKRSDLAAPYVADGTSGHGGTIYRILHLLAVGLNLSVPAKAWRDRGHAAQTAVSRHMSSRLAWADCVERVAGSLSGKMREQNIGVQQLCWKSSFVGCGDSFRWPRDWSRSTALRTKSNSRMAATMATFRGFPVHAGTSSNGDMVPIFPRAGTLYRPTPGSWATSRQAADCPQSLRCPVSDPRARTRGWARRRW